MNNDIDNVIRSTIDEQPEIEEQLIEDEANLKSEYVFTDAVPLENPSNNIEVEVTTSEAEVITSPTQNEYQPFSSILIRENIDPLVLENVDRENFQPQEENQLTGI